MRAGVLCNNVSFVSPEPRSQRKQSAIIDRAIAFTYSKRFFQGGQNAAQQRRKRVILVVNLGQDPEVRYMPNGGAVPTLRWLL